MADLIVICHALRHYSQTTPALSHFREEPTMVFSHGTSSSELGYDEKFILLGHIFWHKKPELVHYNCTFLLVTEWPK